MKKIIGCLAVLLMLGGCATTGINSKTGLSAVVDVTESSVVTASSSQSKVGQACSKNFLGLFSNGDSSIDAAKKAGNITTVSSVDTKFFRVLGFYGEVCTIVHGE